MIPQRRFSSLLHQAQAFQRQHCVYHNSPLDSTFSLYEDHDCNKDAFPGLTTAILEVHKDEVWNIEWSHDGLYLASASRDETAIIWRIGVSHPLLLVTTVIRHLRCLTNRPKQNHQYESILPNLSYSPTNIPSAV